jgi:DNA/RNA endonuclease YhcR with UshA esterase domain
MRTMRKMIAVMAIAMLSVVSVSAQTKNITPEEAAKHIGDTVTVCGKIFGGKYFDQSAKKITLLNMGAAYPKSPLTIVIDEDNRKNFSSAPEDLYNGKNICLTGVVKDFKGKPQIFITKEAEVTVK